MALRCSALRHDSRSRRPSPSRSSPAGWLEQIGAGAYFAWNSDVSNPASWATLQYLIASLSRPTHTAEEAFYNLLRVAGSQHMIYPEDTILSKHIQSPPKPSVPLNPADVYDALDAYGWNGKQMVSYWGNGWTSPKLHGQQVWWLLFAERWSHNALSGSRSLLSCEQYWDKNQQAGLKSVFCNAANDGAVPTKAEVTSRATS